MGKLFKFLKPYAAAVAAIICILVVQAYCDLSLPTYTSDIVNVGIQQGGIDETVPDTISKKDLNHLLLLVPSDRQKTVKNAYTESVEKYDYNGTVMELKASVKEDEKKMDRLSEILGKPMLMAAGFDSGSDMTQKIEEQMRTQMSGIPNVDKMDIYDMLEFMGAEGRNALIGQMDQQMDSMQDSMIAQAAAGYIKDAYTTWELIQIRLKLPIFCIQEPRCWHLHSLEWQQVYWSDYWHHVSVPVSDADFVKMYSVKWLVSPMQNLINSLRHH